MTFVTPGAAARRRRTRYRGAVLCDSESGGDGEEDDDGSSQPILENALPTVTSAQEPRSSGAMADAEADEEHRAAQGAWTGDAWWAASRRSLAAAIGPCNEATMRQRMLLYGRICSELAPLLLGSTVPRPRCPRPLERISRFCRCRRRRRWFRQLQRGCPPCGRRRTRNSRSLSRRLPSANAARWNVSPERPLRCSLASSLFVEACCRHTRMCARSSSNARRKKDRPPKANHANNGKKRKQMYLRILLFQVFSLFVLALPPDPVHQDWLWGGSKLPNIHGDLHSLSLPSSFFRSLSAALSLARAACAIPITHTVPSPPPPPDPLPPSPPHLSNSQRRARIHRARASGQRRPLLVRRARASGAAPAGRRRLSDHPPCHRL